MLHRLIFYSKSMKWSKSGYSILEFIFHENEEREKECKGKKSLSAHTVDDYAQFTHNAICRKEISYRIKRLDDETIK